MSGILLRGIGVGLILYCFASGSAKTNHLISLACAVAIAVASWTFRAVQGGPRWIGLMEAVAWYLLAVAVADLALVIFGLPFGERGLLDQG